MIEGSGFSTLCRPDGRGFLLSFDPISKQYFVKTMNTRVPSQSAIELPKNAPMCVS